MKLIMENWRKYLEEEEKNRLDEISNPFRRKRGWEKEAERQEDEEEKEAGCRTVGVLIRTLDQMQKGEKEAETKASTKGWASQLAHTLIGMVPVIGTVVGSAKNIYDIVKQTKDQINSEKGDVSYDEVADYPILGHLKIDPELVKVLEDDILRQLDEMYEKEILTKVKSNTCIDKIPSINEFIRSEIAVETKKHVVIDDESGTGV